MYAATRTEDEAPAPMSTLPATTLSDEPPATSVPVPAGQGEPSRLARYAVGMGAPLAALAVSFALRDFLAATVFIFFFAAVTLTAWYGGRGPSLLATALSVVFANYFVTAPAFTWSLDAPDLLRAALFAAIALLIGSMRESLDAARRAAAARAAELEEANLRLHAFGIEAPGLAANCSTIRITRRRLRGSPTSNALISSSAQPTAILPTSRIIKFLQSASILSRYYSGR